MKRFLHPLRISIAVLGLAGAAIAPGVLAQGGGADEVLAENSYAKVTRGDYEAELQRLPPDMRGGFGNSGKRVFDLVSRLLLTKSLAAEARKNGLDKDPAIQRRIALEIDRFEAALEVAKIEEDAARAFASAARSSRRGRGSSTWPIATSTVPPSRCRCHISCSTPRSTRPRRR